MSAHSYESIWVVKVGSSLVTDGGKGLALARLDAWVAQIAELRKAGVGVVLVSSGAVVEGMTRLGLSVWPKSVHRIQAAAAVGQMGLVQAYERSFERFGLHTAQVLLTHDDLRSRQRYLNARSTLRELLAFGVVPVVNENDTVVTDEIRFGDNDTLAARLANLVEAEQLVIMTDQQGLYSAPPGKPGAELIEEAAADDGKLDAMAGTGSGLGRGGMVSKLAAARIAARSGADTVICSGDVQDVLLEVHRCARVGTRLTAGQGSLVARKQWLATLAVKGRLMLDAGACRVLAEQGKSLLPIGVTATAGDYGRGDMVACLDDAGKEVARGLVNYDHAEVTRIIGKPSGEIENVLGYVAEEELIHRDNMVLS